MSCFLPAFASSAARMGRMMPSAFARTGWAMDARMITTITTAAT
jgi:hypothetical protein